MSFYDGIIVFHSLRHYRPSFAFNSTECLCSHLFILIRSKFNWKFMGGFLAARIHFGQPDNSNDKLLRNRNNGIRRDMRSAVDDWDEFNGMFMGRDCHIFDLFYAVMTTRLSFISKRINSHMSKCVQSVCLCVCAGIVSIPNNYEYQFSQSCCIRAGLLDRRIQCDQQCHKASLSMPRQHSSRVRR